MTKILYFAELLTYIMYKDLQQEGDVIITNGRRTANKIYPVLTMLAGFISFLISGIIAGLISLKTNEGLILIFGVPMGSLIMLFVLRKLSKDKVLKIIILSELGGFAGFLAGFTIGELLGGIAAFIFASKSQIIPNMFVLIIADAVFGAILAGLLYGRKSIRLFALVCGIASIPFGLLLSMPIDITWFGFDQNLLFSVISFGTTTGLSIGLYDRSISVN